MNSWAVSTMWRNNWVFACDFTVWLGCTPEQLRSLAVDPSGQRGDTDTQYLLTALSSTDTETSTSDNNLWKQQEWKEVKRQH